MYNLGSHLLTYVFVLLGVFKFQWFIQCVLAAVLVRVIHIKVIGYSYMYVALIYAFIFCHIL